LTGSAPAGRRAGATLPIIQLSGLAHAWWGDRLEPDWRPHTRDHNQAILTSVGLTDDFWRLPSRPSSTPEATTERAATRLTDAPERQHRTSWNLQPRPRPIGTSLRL
jgi:hypothetical protein